MGRTSARFSSVRYTLQILFSCHKRTRHNHRASPAARRYVPPPGRWCVQRVRHPEGRRQDQRQRWPIACQPSQAKQLAYVWEGRLLHGHAQQSQDILRDDRKGSRGWQD
ncbi:unnamed protein product [Ectocarpus sp. 4 AP-2014]